MAAVLLIADDPPIWERLERALHARGHRVLVAAEGPAGLRRVVEDRPDLVLLDLALVDLDVRDLLRRLRAVSEVPVVVSTGRDSETELGACLDAGADDFLVEPYSAEQLDARLRAALGRRPRPNGTAVTVGGLWIEPASHRVTLDGAEIRLTRKEFELLHHLARNAGHVLTKRQLLADVWQQPFGGADKTVDVHLSWLRKKLGESADAPRYIRSIRGVGVKVVDPDA